VGQIKVPILLSDVTVYSSQNSSHWEGEHPFSFAFPAETNVNGIISPLPPSFVAYHPGTSNNISYVIKIDMVRKGLRRRER